MSDVSTEDEEDLELSLEKLAEKREEAIKKGEYFPEVSEWTDDTIGVEEEKNPHESPSKEILWAAEHGDLEVLKKLLDKDKSLVGIRDQDGYTPLHRACYHNHSDAVKMLLQHGADESAKTNDDWQPLHSACKWNSLESAMHLLSYGADINAMSKGGVTPLHLVAGNSEARRLIEVILTNPELIHNVKDKAGDTPLDIARRNGPHEALFELTNPCFL